MLILLLLLFFGLLLLVLFCCLMAGNDPGSQTLSDQEQLEFIQAWLEKKNSLKNS